VRIILKLLVDTFTALEGQIAELDAAINRRSKAHPIMPNIPWNKGRLTG